MELSSRIQDVSESLTLKLNAKAVKMAEEGEKVYNLTAGQLPFRPMGELVDLMKGELDFLKSFQYSPVPGDAELRAKLIKYVEESRGIDFSKVDEEFGAVVSNGGKHALINVLAALLNPGDEAVMIAPYWVSYPEMVKFCGAIPRIVQTSIYDGFVPSIDELRETINHKTKVIIINSPNNPSGTHYSDAWMKDFAELMTEFPDVNIISDEIYYELFYFDPKPTYFYQHNTELLKRTIIVDGISKNLACTGLRIGYIIAPTLLTSAISRLQGQTTSGANSLIQRALVNFDFSKISEFLSPIKTHLRSNANTVREMFNEQGLSKSWYQSSSAFYYMVDFSGSPVIERFKTNPHDHEDYSMQICEELLEKHGVATVPGSAFGMPNSARISLVLQEEPFNEAMKLIMSFLSNGKQV